MVTLTPYSVLLISNLLYKMGNAEMESKIVGGSEVSIDSYPHSAFLKIYCTDSVDTDSWICGSSIVNQWILLTAAHCMDDCVPGNIKMVIAVGSTDRKSKTQQLASASKFYVHEKYDTQEVANDIALVLARSKINLGPRVKRVVLMKKPPYGEQAYVAGWGAVDEKTKQNAQNLKHTVQKVWSYQSCRRILHSLPVGAICGGDLRVKDYVALGDSGSALIVRGYIQIGIVSYKVPATSKSLSVYTDVGYFYDWIVEKSRKLYCRE